MGRVQFRRLPARPRSLWWPRRIPEARSRKGRTAGPRLFRLAWDIAGTSFGSRQVLYERFFAGDPLTRARVVNAIYPKDEVKERVWGFLRDDGEAAG